MDIGMIVMQSVLDKSTIFIECFIECICTHVYYYYVRF